MNAQFYQRYVLVLILQQISLQFNPSLPTEDMVASKVIVFFAFTIIIGDEARANVLPDHVLPTGYTYSKGKISW